MNEERKNWVRERARCTAEALFAELVEQVTSDAKTMSDLSPIWNFHVKITKDNPPTNVFVERIRRGRSGSVASVNFERRDNEITTAYVRNDRGTVEQRKAVAHWDADNTRALLSIKETDETYEIWEFSELVLTDLFFPQ